MASRNKLGKHAARAALCLALAGSSLASAGDLPDPRITPGAINPEVTQENIHSTVCVKGWTKTVRPPMYYTNRLKKEQIREYGYADRNPRDYEEDHLVPLGAGGNPTDPHNLWPQPRDSEWGADRKDELEFAMYKGLCHGEVSLAEAQDAFRTNWIESYKRYGNLIEKYSHHSSGGSYGRMSANAGSGGFIRPIVSGGLAGFRLLRVRRG